MKALRYLGLFLLISTVPPSVFAQVFTIDNHTASFTKPDCKPLAISASGDSISVFIYNQVVWHLTLNSQVIDSEVDPFWGLTNSPIDFNHTEPARGGTYSLTEKNLYNNFVYPPITVTLPRPNPRPCPPDTTLDGNYCLYRSVPAGGFIFNNTFYVLSTRGEDCVYGKYDSRNCFIMRVPENGFIFNNSFYVKSNPPPTRCPPTVGSSPAYPTHFDGANCFIFTAPWGTMAFKFGNPPNWYTQALSSCPFGTTFDGANCVVKAAPSGMTAMHFNNNWYLTPPNWCL
jgi:hypothetical protein